MKCFTFYDYFVDNETVFIQFKIISSIEMAVT